MSTAEDHDVDSTQEETVLYEVRERVAVITLNRPRFANAQNDQMLYALDAALLRAANDDGVGAIMLRGAGKHFSSGHDTGTPDRYAGRESVQRRTMFYNANEMGGSERLYIREQEVYLGLCRRWQELPKAMVAAVQGACIAGGLMIAWVCDIIVASDDAFFSDPVVKHGIPGVEYAAHAFEMAPRIAREFLLLGDRMSADRAFQVGMVNRVVQREELDDVAFDMARRIAQQPRFAIALTKQHLNMVENLRGKRSAMDAAFGLHHLAHAHNLALYGDSMLWNRDKNITDDGSKADVDRDPSA